MKGIRVASVLVLAVVVVLALTGCQLLAQKAAEKATGVSVDKTGSQVTITGPSGQSATIQSNQNSLPEGLPDTVPSYSGTIKSSAAVSSPTGTAYTYTISTADDAKTVTDWYAKNLADKGWTVEQTVALPNGGIVSAKTATADIGVTVTDDNGQRAISVIVNVKK